MKFVKIKFGKSNEVQWRLAISNEEDLIAFGTLETEENFRAYLSSKDENLVEGTRAYNANRIMQMGVSMLREGERKSPVLIMAEMQDKKILGMLKAINVAEICVNEAGGYCFLDNFLSQHNAEVIETLYKNDLGFPNEEDVVFSDLVILENDAVVDKALMRDLVENGIVKDKTKYVSFTHLKLQDRSYVFNTIEKTKAVATQTQVMDMEQIDAFIAMFLMLKDRKDILIKTFNAEALKNHPKYNMVCEKHNVKFI